RYLHLGKVALYQMSYGRMEIGEFFSAALSGRRVLLYTTTTHLSSAFSALFNIFFNSFFLRSFHR
ncbi:hypothetical protein, partial [uncultured Subdoligranulum sp.]|uniref:hypothetical protein n=1 Tax=uncultured Subdoligranulum sp. TaxID=512298 RepID=UPI0025DCD3EC